MDDTYRIALEEANKMHQKLKTERSVTKEPKRLKPPPYVKLKVRFSFSSLNNLSLLYRIVTLRSP